MIVLVTNSVGQSHYWEADSLSAGEVIVGPFWYQKLYYHLHKISPPCTDGFRWTKYTPSQSINLRHNLILSSRLRLGLHSYHFTSSFKAKMWYAFISHMTHWQYYLSIILTRSDHLSASMSLYLQYLYCYPLFHL